MAHGTRGWLLWGAFWLHISFILDNCDGELARLKSAHTRLGEWYDLVADVFVDYALWIGLAAGAFAVPGGPDARGWAIAACFGSTMNFGTVIWERRAGCSTSVHSDYALKHDRKKNMFLRLLDGLSHDGNVIFLIWIMALMGRPALFLLYGCIYINLIWIWRLFSHRKVFLA